MLVKVFSLVVDVLLALAFSADMQLTLSSSFILSFFFISKNINLASKFFNIISFSFLMLALYY